MEYSKESLDRQKKIQDLKIAWVIPYANHFHGKEDIIDIRSKEDKIKNVDDLMNSWAIWDFKTAWRLMSSRWMWKLIFWSIRDHSSDIQLCFMRWLIKFNTGKKIVEEIEIDWLNKTAFKIAEKFCQVGDYIWLTWDLFYTKHNELTLFVKEFQILSKAVRPLPEKFHGVTDQETIYRQRYLDLIMNKDSYERFKFRSDFIKAIRDFYEKNKFTEIETNVLWNAASWAAAKPFITHHNDYDEEFYLRIAPEVWLKKATVWRFEKVFEFARNFRNEWSDPSHVQEFSVFEHYAAWWNFEDNMKFTEDMFDYIFDTLKLDRKIEIEWKDEVKRIVDFTTPWERIDYIAWVKEKSWIDIEAYTAEDEEKLRSDIKAAGYTWEWIDNQVTATMIDYLYKKVLRPGIIGPAFVYNYPKTMQPLARQSDENENRVEQFQLLLNGWEILKAYSELVDPKLQQENFDEQSGAIEKGDEEATSWDDDFVLAMEYAMPCQSGWGMWVERIVSLLTGQNNLRDVQLFPLMKSEKIDEKMQTNLAVALINKEANMELWQEMNTIAHLNAAYWANEGKGLFLHKEAKTKDGVSLKMNTSHAIMIKESDTWDKLKELIKNARDKSLLVTEFTREMLETSDDNKILEDYKDKNFEKVEHLWILVYWKMPDVKKITEDFELYSSNNSSTEENK